ncbi:MAG: hypothetical protein ACT4P5_09860 [Armatimonadota bacterium]
MPTYPTSPAPTSITEDTYERRAITGDYRAMVRHVRNRDPLRLRRVHLGYRRVSRSAVDTFVTFYNDVKGRSSRFDFTHPSPVNLLRNPGFEQGLSEWTPTNAVDVVVGTPAESRRGVGCAKITAPTPAAVRRADTRFIPMTSGRPLFLSGWVRASVGAGSSGAIHVDFYNASQVFMSFLAAVDGAPLPTTWTQFAAATTTPANTAFVRAVVRVKVEATPGVVHFFDDILVTLDDPRFKARLLDDRLAWRQLNNDTYEFVVGVEEAP